jgi:hypothetical protein
MTETEPDAKASHELGAVSPRERLAASFALLRCAEHLRTG